MNVHAWKCAPEILGPAGCMGELELIFLVVVHPHDPMLVCGCHYQLCSESIPLGVFS